MDTRLPSPTTLKKGKQAWGEEFESVPAKVALLVIPSCTQTLPTPSPLTSSNSARGKKKGGIPTPDGLGLCMRVGSGSWPGHTHTDVCLQLGRYITAQACAESE